MDMLSAWTSGQLSDYITALRRMQSNGVTTVEQAIAEVARAQAALVEAAPAGEARPSTLPGLQCQDCGASAISVAPVNVSRCTRVEGGWRSTIECRNPECRHIEYSMLSVDDLLRKLRKLRRKR